MGMGEGWLVADFVYMRRVFKNKYSRTQSIGGRGGVKDWEEKHLFFSLLDIKNLGASLFCSSPFKHLHIMEEKCDN